MTRTELLNIPKRKWNVILHGVTGVYVIPSGRKHDSGYACMDFVATFRDGRPPVRFGGVCDAVSFNGNGFRMDCEYPTRIVHIWNSRRPFSVSDDLSSITFTEDQEDNR